MIPVHIHGKTTVPRTAVSFKLHDCMFSPKIVLMLLIVTDICFHLFLLVK